MGMYVYMWQISSQLGLECSFDSIPLKYRYDRMVGTSCVFFGPNASMSASWDHANSVIFGN